MNLFSKLLTTAFLCLNIGCTAELKVESNDSASEPNPITWTECSQDAGDHPCDFTLENHDALTWSLYENYGSIIVLDFSTEWCGYCQRSAQTIQALQDLYADDDVIIVTVMIEDRYGNPANTELIQNWATHFGITAPVLAGSRDLLSTDTRVGWPVTAYPSYFFIDREMVLKFNQRGYSDEGIRMTIDSMLEIET